MATKKKVTRKAAAPKTFKRKYARKAKPLPVEESPKGEEANGVAVATFVLAQNNLELLSEIDVIDLRDVPVFDRIILFNMLGNEGYLTTTVQPFLENHQNLLAALNTEAIQLFHANRLVGLSTWEEAKESRKISRPFVRTDANIGFTPPEPGHPDTVEINGAVYHRIA